MVYVEHVAFLFKKFIILRRVICSLFSFLLIYSQSVTKGLGGSFALYKPSPLALMSTYDSQLSNSYIVISGRCPILILLTQYLPIPTHTMIIVALGFVFDFVKR